MRSAAAGSRRLTLGLAASGNRSTSDGGDHGWSSMVAGAEGKQKGLTLDREALWTGRNGRCHFGSRNNCRGTWSRLRPPDELLRLPPPVVMATVAGGRVLSAAPS